LTSRNIIHESDRSICRKTIVGGVFFLAPIVVLIVILAKAFGFAKTGLQAVVPHIPGVSDLSVGVATALSIAMIALVCILAGLIAHTLIAQRLHWRVLSRELNLVA
jgi:uncharacterized membrane protein